MTLWRSCSATILLSYISVFLNIQPVFYVFEHINTNKEKKIPCFSFWTDYVFLIYIFFLTMWACGVFFPLTEGGVMRWGVATCSEGFWGYKRVFLDVLGFNDAVACSPAPVCTWGLNTREGNFYILFFTVALHTRFYIFIIFYIFASKGGSFKKIMQLCACRLL